MWTDHRDCSLCTCISRHFLFLGNAWNFSSWFGDPDSQSWAMCFLISIGNKGWIILPDSEGNLIITGQLSLRDSLHSIW